MYWDAIQQTFDILNHENVKISLSPVKKQLAYISQKPALFVQILQRKEITNE